MKTISVYFFEEFVCHIRSNLDITEFKKLIHALLNSDYTKIIMSQKAQ